MILNDLAYDCEAKPGTVRLAVADERLEESKADRLWNARPIVPYADFKAAVNRTKFHADRRFCRRSRLAGVQQQVEHDAFQFFGVEHARHVVIGLQGDIDAAKFRLAMNGVDGLTDNLRQVGGHRRDGATLR